MSYPSTGPMRWRDPDVSGSRGMIPRSLPGQENTGALTGSINRAAPARPPAPVTTGGPVAAGLLAFTVLIAVAIVVVDLAGLHLPGRTVLAVLTLIFGPGIPAAMLLKLPSALVEFVIGVALSLSAAMLLPAALVEAHAFSATTVMILLNGATVLLAGPVILAMTGSTRSRGRR